MHVDPEDQLLITLAQQALPEHLRDHLSSLGKEFNWDRFVQRSLEEDVYPMVCRNILNAGEEFSPPHARDQLRRLYEMNAIRVDILRNELHKILELFSANQIEVVPLKGLALSERLYQDGYLRSSVDIDVLVRQEAVGPAVGLLSTVGYSSELFDTGLDFESNAHDHMLLKRVGSFVIQLELHWAIMWGSALDRPAMKLLWDTASSQEFLGTKVVQWSPEGELLFLAGHAARSLWIQLKVIVDVAERAKKDDINWTTFWKMSAATGWDRAVRWSLQSSQLILGRPMAGLGVSPALPSWIKLFPEKTSRPLIQVAEIADPRLLDRPSSRLRFLLIALLTPRSVDRRWIRFPKSLHCLYFLLRPLRLASIILKRISLRMFNAFIGAKSP